MPEVRHALKDILAGSIFIGLGVAFALGALAYNVGSPDRMGAGYFPLILGVFLAGLGLLVIVKGFLAGEGEPIGPVAWRAAVMITAALVFFGLTIRGLGVVGALFGTTLLAAMARSATTLREALLICVGLTILSLLIFVVALQLRLPLVGPWIPF